jgi:hypothetical protein
MVSNVYTARRGEQRTLGDGPEDIQLSFFGADNGGTAPLILGMPGHGGIRIQQDTATHQWHRTR